MLRFVLIVVASACVVLLMSTGVAVSGCGEAREITQASGTTATVATTSSTVTSGASSTTSSTSSSVDTTVITVVAATPILISGAAVVDRPDGTVLFSKKWGAAPGEVGHGVWEQGAPSQNPIEFAISPDETAVAILDYANSRVELFSRDGAFGAVIPLPSTTAFADISFNVQGRLFVLSYADLVLELPTQDEAKIQNSLSSRISLPTHSRQMGLICGW